jgi:hypothetical protein
MSDDKTALLGSADDGALERRLCMANRHGLLLLDPNDLRARLSQVAENARQLREAHERTGLHQQTN